MASTLTHPTIVGIDPACPAFFKDMYKSTTGLTTSIAMTLKVKKILHVEKSKYQDVLVFESTNLGVVLVLDGVIQCTESDEFSYQEMITHLALYSHPHPRNVLVIGGGDGGVLREVFKHPCVESATLCDIDEAVPRVSKQYLPGMAAGFDDPRAVVHIGDGFEFLRNRKGQFDAIITDSSDPEGPAEVLFQKPYFELLNKALREGGVISTQAESQWLHLPLIANLKRLCSEVFPVAEYGFTTIPTYPSGQIGFMVCCKDASRDVRAPVRPVDSDPADQEEGAGVGEGARQYRFRYYNAEIHRASFVLPSFARRALLKAVGGKHGEGTKSMT